MNDAEILVQQALTNDRQICDLTVQADTKRKEVETEIYRLKYDVYWKIIRDLERKRDAEIQALQADLDAQKVEHKAKTESLYTAVAEVKRILQFLKLKPQNLEINDDDIKTYRERYKENLGYLFEDSYLKIKLFIVESEKPKNKYALVAYGKCLFKDQFNYSLLDLPYSYGITSHESDHYSLRVLSKMGLSKSGCPKRVGDMYLKGCVDLSGVHSRCCNIGGNLNIQKTDSCLDEVVRKFNFPTYGSRRCCPKNISLRFRSGDWDFG